MILEHITKSVVHFVVTTKQHLTPFVSCDYTFIWGVEGIIKVYIPLKQQNITIIDCDSTGYNIVKRVLQKLLHFGIRNPF